MNEKQTVIAMSGRDGFIGRKVALRLDREADVRMLPLARDDFRSAATLASALDGAGTIIHLAAKNRADPEELYSTNVGLVRTLVEAARLLTIQPHILFASSTQRTNDSAYGRSKRDGEKLLVSWARESGAPLTLLVIPNVFGPGCRPFYNSVVATFAYRFARGERPEIQIDKELELVHVADLAEVIARAALHRPSGVSRPTVEPTYRRTVSLLFADFERFALALFGDRTVPALRTRLDALLYSTFQSYLAYEGFRYGPPLHQDPRGVLMECVRQELGGQVFFSTTKHGVIRGNHYHTRKLEKFCVLKGEAVIRLRRVGSSEVVEYRVSGERPEILDIPVFHAHNIENVGDEDLYTLFWASEIFDPDDPDTYPEEV